MARTASTSFTAGQFAERLNPPSRQSALTICMWFRAGNLSSSNHGFFALYDYIDGVEEIEGDILRWNGWGTQVRGQFFDGASYFTTENYAGLSSGWHFIALVYDGLGNLEIYRKAEGGSISSVRTGAIPSAWDADRLRLASDTWTDLVDHMQHCRVWESALSQTQLDTESQYDSPQVTANLWAEWDLVAGSMSDGSGNSRDLTATGTPSSGVDGPDLNSSGPAATTVEASFLLPEILATLELVVAATEVETTITLPEFEASAELQNVADAQVSITLPEFEVSAELQNIVDAQVSIELPSLLATFEAQSVSDVQASITLPEFETALELESDPTEAEVSITLPELTATFEIETDQPDVQATIVLPEFETTAELEVGATEVETTIVLPEFETTAELEVGATETEVSIELPELGFAAEATIPQNSLEATIVLPEFEAASELEVGATETEVSIELPSFEVGISLVADVTVTAEANFELPSMSFRANLFTTVPVVEFTDVTVTQAPQQIRSRAYVYRGIYFQTSEKKQ